MKLIFTFVVVSVVLSMLLIAAPAHAATVADCQAQIDTLRAQTQQATFTGQNATQDQARLVDKLDTAAAKLAAGKNADAVQKMIDFRDKVTQLDAQGKISHEDAVMLINGANQVIACIEGLTAS